MATEDTRCSSLMTPHSSLIFLCSLLIALSLFTGCATLMRGTAGAILLQMAPIGLELFELPAKLDLKVTNPYPVNVRISNVKYEVLIEGRSIARGEQASETIVPKEGSVVLSVPLSISAGEALSGIKTTLTRRGVKYQVRGSYTVASETESEFRVSSLLKPLLRRK